MSTPSVTQQKWRLEDRDVPGPAVEAVADIARLYVAKGGAE